MVDLLAGALTGGGCSRPRRHGALRQQHALDRDRARGLHRRRRARAEVERYLAFVKSSRPRARAAVLLPGEPEQRARAERRAQGVPIDPTTWNHIMAAGERLGLARGAGALAA